MTNSSYGEHKMRLQCWPSFGKLSVIRLASSVALSSRRLVSHRRQLTVVVVRFIDRRLSCR